MDIYIYILHQNAKNAQKQQSYAEICGKNTQTQQTHDGYGEEWDIRHQTDSTSHKNPTYVSHESQREIT